MAQSLWDKTFFMDKISPLTALIVDYGCADGALIKLLAPMFPNITFFGYDTSKQMIQEAKENYQQKNVEFFREWKALTERLKEFEGCKKAIICSSVIHEVYSYCGQEEIEKFWGRIFGVEGNWDYICIREMALSEDAFRPSSGLDVIKVIANSYSSMLRDFTDTWGSIQMNNNLIHYLLKSRYVENWKRECKENYLPLTFEELVSLWGPRYSPIYCEHYVLPYIYESVKFNYDVELKDPTHIKLILKKNY